MHDPPTSRETRINLLVEEYRSLRDEQKQGMGDRITLLGFLSVAAAFVIANHNAVWAFVVAAALLAVPTAVWYRTWRLLDKRSQHIAALEQRINALALNVDDESESDELLSWETNLCQRRKELTESDNPLERTWGRVLYREQVDDPAPPLRRLA